VNTGVTLTIAPNSTLTFQSGTSLTVNGILTANGTSSQSITFAKSGTSNWGGIIFNGGSSGEISYTNISGANYAIQCNYALPSIHNNTISGNTYGIYVANVGATSTSIAYNTIQSNSNSGIYLYYSSPTVSHNTVQNNGSGYGYGLSCFSSSPNVSSNYLAHNHSEGVYLSYYSAANIVSYNQIGYNGTGIYATYQCNARIAGNSIKSNTWYNLQGYQPLYIDARYNYWGAYPPDPTKISATNGASIDYSYYLGYDPTGGFNKSTSSEMVSNYATGGSFFDQELMTAIDFQKVQRYDEAVSVYDKIARREPQTDKGMYALIQLKECYSKSHKKGFADYLNKVIFPSAKNDNKLLGIATELQTNCLIEDGEDELAITNLLKIRKDFSNDSEKVKYALFNTGMVYLASLNNYHKAKEAFDELAEKYPIDVLTQDSKTLLATFVPTNRNEISLPKQTQQEKKIIPTECALSQSYPNPFNPTTNISYSLSEPGTVELTVFDVLGRRVSEIVHEYQTVGSRTVKFDGSAFPSGVYFVRLTTGGKEFTQRLLLLK